ncbi:MAG: efflux RND transporter periplasmic adaptor subunit, partial [Planctomycetota bacterium]
MDNAQMNPSPSPETGPPPVPRWATWTARLVLAAAVLAATGWISYYWLTNRPKAKRHRPKPQATLVEVNEVSRQSRRAVVRAMGTVVPAQQIQLASQVGGRVVEVSPEFVPGGRLQAGKRVLQVEPSDYQIAVRQRASDLARAQSELRLEMARQAVARREYELLGKDVSAEDREFLLRKPQLASAKAAVAAAEAALERAKLDLARTSVPAPFNATVQSRNVELGSHVNVGAALASVVGTDEYWVQVSVPADELRWIQVPGPDGRGGSEARVYWESAWGPRRFRSGTVGRLMTNLEPQGRMAQLLIAVRDPLDLNSPPERRCPVLLEACVRVEIYGREARDVVRVPRAALREGGRVWVMTDDGTLEIRDVEITLSGDEEVYVSAGLATGDRLITSDL